MLSIKKELILILAFVFLINLHNVSSIDINTCQTLSTGTYRLTQDISTPGTCFTITQPNIVIDLNGKTLTYGTSPGISYAVLETTTSNTDGLVIKNGRIIQGGNDAFGYGSTTIDIYSMGYMEVTNLTIIINSPGTTAFNSEYLGGGLFYGNHIIINAQTYYQAPDGGVWTNDGFVFLRGLGFTVANNIIENSNIGIAITSSFPGFNDNIRIYNNVILGKKQAKNPYSILLYETDGAIVYNNTILSNDGRGIFVEANHYSEIYDNIINVTYSTPPGPMDGELSVGIRVRPGEAQCEGCCNKIHDNNITVRAKMYQAMGIFLTTVLNNTFYNNVINVIDEGNPVTLRDCYVAASGICIQEVPAGNNFLIYTPPRRPDCLQTPPEGPGNLFFNNTVTSNSGNIIFADAQNITFISNKFIRGSNPINYFTIQTFDYGPLVQYNAVDNKFVDTSFSNLASFDSYRFTYPSSFYVQWFLNVSVKDNLNQPVQGANVQIRDFGNNLVFNGLTGIDGKIKTIQTQYLQANVGKTFHTPHSVIVTKLTASSTTSVILDASKEHVVILNLGSCPDGNNDSIVNIKDLALVAYWQGKTNTDPNWNNIDHLDLDADGRIGVSDISVIISSFGVSC